MNRGSTAAPLGARRSSRIAFTYLYRIFVSLSSLLHKIKMNGFGPNSFPFSTKEGKIGEVKRLQTDTAEGQEETRAIGELAKVAEVAHDAPRTL
jgi:hypothetical protein